MNSEVFPRLKGDVLGQLTFSFDYSNEDGVYTMNHKVVSSLSQDRGSNIETERNL